MGHLNCILKAVLLRWVGKGETSYLGERNGQGKDLGAGRPVPCQKASCHGLGISLWERGGGFLRFKEQVESSWGEP